MSVVTRFAPSPTGYLHIGGCRTALFNWLFARHHGGRFVLRIEDTDRKRSTPEAIAAILEGLAWLELEWDGEAVYQSQRRDRHAAVVKELLDAGRAYRCFCTPDELEEMRRKARAEGRPDSYDGRWRDRDPAEAPAGVKPAIRVKAPRTGETVIEDRVQGRVTIANQQLDDMILLRADGTPTYMLSVVVDDHDMGITHVIRGDDHLTNAFRQTILYQALDWATPAFAHIPLIHGPDGAKLSKRHGALGIESYRDAGYLPQALRNYLLRLGWSHGDDELISTEEAIAWFGLDGVGRSPARFDQEKLDSVNAHYIRQSADQALADLVAPRLAAETGGKQDEAAYRRLLQAMPALKERVKTLVELAANAKFLVARPAGLTAKAAKILDPEARDRLRRLIGVLEGLELWDEPSVEAAVRHFAETEGVKLGAVAQPLRAALTGSHASPGIFEVMAVLGGEECHARLAKVPEIEA